MNQVQLGESSPHAGKARGCQTLPAEYCPACASERPEEFAFIRDAEERGCIVFTAFCGRHAVEFIREQAGFLSPRERDGRVVCEFAGQVWSGKCLPRSGMQFREERAA